VKVDSLTETDDGWELPFRGALVTRCYIDPHAVGLLLDEANVYLEGSFELAKAGEPAELGVGDDPTAYVPLISLIGHNVSEARAPRDGQLVLGFSDGSSLTAKPDPNYEAWNLTFDGLTLVCQPGGGVAVFRPSPGNAVRADHLDHGPSEPNLA
jgi:hypothetical protein